MSSPKDSTTNDDTTDQDAIKFFDEQLQEAEKEHKQRVIELSFLSNEGQFLALDRYLKNPLPEALELSLANTPIEDMSKISSYIDFKAESIKKKEINETEVHLEDQIWVEEIQNVPEVLKMKEGEQVPEVQEIPEMYVLSSLLNCKNPYIYIVVVQV